MTETEVLGQCGAEHTTLGFIVFNVKAECFQVHV